MENIQFQVFLEGQVQKEGINNHILSIYLGWKKKGRAMYNVNSYFFPFSSILPITVSVEIQEPEMICQYSSSAKTLRLHKVLLEYA